MITKVYIHKLDSEVINREGFGDTGLLPICRRKKIGKIKNKEARNQSYAAGRLLVILLSEVLGLDEKEAVNLLDSDNHSEEERIVSSGDKVLHYNISHSGELVTVAVSDMSIGIDIECKTDKDFRITGRMFAEEDKTYVADSQERFREVWTAKEAFLKCTGKGISVPLSSFTMDYSGEYIENGYSVRRVLSKGYDLEGGEYYIYSKKIEDFDYSFSVCSENKNLLLDMVWVEVLL